MKNFRIPAVIALCLAFCVNGFSQAHDKLIDLSRSEAAQIASILGLEQEAAGKLSGIYVREALATVDLIVNAEPEVEVIKEIEDLRKTRYNEVKDLLDDAEFSLYKHYLDSEEERLESQFDSLRSYLRDEEFVEKTLTYYDDNVAPFVIYYHQTYFRPALRQKHVWKINEIRQWMRDFEYQQSRAETDHEAVPDMVAAWETLDKGIGQLKRIRKRYRDELDYINVAMGVQEVEWTTDFIAIVKENFPDEVYQEIIEHRAYTKAYGMDYILGTFSMILFDVYDPRSYIQSRAALSEAYEASLRRR